jgi:hypothetical protein
MNSINLRIFRRTNSNISFLFNNSALEGKKLQDLKIYNIEDKDRKEPLVHVAAVDEKTNTVQVVIDHQRNNLDANKTYVFVFNFKDYDVNIKVYPTEVLPVSEKDSASKNQHLYGWCEEERKWVKLKAVKDASGEYVLAVKMVK